LSTCIAVQVQVAAAQAAEDRGFDKLAVGMDIQVGVGSGGWESTAGRWEKSTRNLRPTLVRVPHAAQGVDRQRQVGQVERCRGRGGIAFALGRHWRVGLQVGIYMSLPNTLSPVGPGAALRLDGDAKADGLPGIGK
jgi:hypothetical protein